MCVLHITLFAMAVTGQVTTQKRSLHEWVDIKDLHQASELVMGAQGQATAIRTPKGDLEPQEAIDATAADWINQIDLLEGMDTLTESPEHQSFEYHAVFNPSIAPFKRVRVFDQVTAQGAMQIADPILKPVQVMTPKDGIASRKKFWASMTMNFQSSNNRPTPLPSVSPDMRILQARVQPATTLQFSKDGADNFYVQSNRVGEFRLTLLVDANKGYFSPQLSGSPSKSQINYLKSLVAGKLSGFGKQTKKVWQAMQVSPKHVIQDFDKIVEYYRSFEAGQLEAPSGDAYLDIALSQKGVCRHRSYAFTITALSAGLPTRMILNEAHAFTEVYLPRQGWVRVDLGGAVSNLDVRSSAEVTMSTYSDPFSKPESYLASDTNAATPNGASENSGDASVDGASNGQSQANDSAQNRIPNEGVQLQVNWSALPAKLERGQSVVLSGTVHQAHQNHPVQIFLSGNDGVWQSLGKSMVGVDGKFSLEKQLPANMNTGAFEVIVQLLNPLQQ
jgi:hypothetical protein